MLLVIAAKLDNFFGVDSAILGVLSISNMIRFDYFKKIFSTLYSQTIVQIFR
jgi:hypothetical protein